MQFGPDSIQPDFQSRNLSRFATYANDDEIQTGPGAGKVPPEAKCNPLEDHLDGEQDGEDHVHDLQDEHQLLVVLQVDVLEAKGKTAAENK